MALTDKLTMIANAIRAKTGGTGTMTLDQMPTEIANIPTGGTPSTNTYRVATGTITPGSRTITINHNLNSTKVIVLLQGKVDTAITAQYRTIAGTWFSDDFLSTYLENNRIYDVSSYSTGLPDGLTVPFSYIGGHAISSGPAANQGATSTPNSTLTATSNNNDLLRIICPNANSTQVIIRYNTQTGMIFDYVVIAFD